VRSDVDYKSPVAHLVRKTETVRSVIRSQSFCDEDPVVQPI